ncbi:mitochondrial inner membrane protein OXA1-like [Chenopodium quinoa]|uniref:mitochondrial inner membrane protein OXA1-like n=1 Tax=Chenopodium quinoa TaxID=63459 RepID=UPI000B783B37|nr:mitochondrial inner membrane protein OXA1-like [Chenopodium quinoa]XP_021757662.1 mitochondrial inner membrane protein OXA1-like [Chenopodium quinoa]
MAYRRSVCARATLLARRINPCFSYISHDNDKNNNNDKPESSSRRKIDDLLAERRSFGTYSYCSLASSSLFHHQRSFFPGHGTGAISFHRYMSTSVGEESDKVGFITDVADVMSDTTVDAVASQAPVLSEVATAAADSAIPVAALQYFIDGVHSFTGLNWWASIALTTLMIRGVTVPFLISQLKATAKLTIMRPRLEEIKAEMEATGNTDEGRLKMNEIFKEYGVTPFTPLKGLLIQGPVFISFFLAISNMAEKVPSFKEGGAFWFTDLTTPDARYILPVLTAVTFLITVELNMQEGMEGNPVASTMKKFSRGLAVLTVPFTMSFPKAIFCYWITSNCFSFAYGAVLKIPGVKKSLGVPDIPVPPPNSQQKTSGFSLLEALKQATAPPKAPAALPAAADQAKSIDEKTSSSSSSAVLSQRLKSLERKVKQKKKNKKR